MSTSYPSNPSVVFDLPEIEDLSVTFKYGYFTQGESIYPADDDATLDGIDLAKYGYPRKIIIDIKKDTLNNLSISDSVAENLSAEQIAQILSSENFAKATNEASLQSVPATRLAFMAMPSIQATIANDSNTDDAASNYDSFSMIQSSVSTDVADLISGAVSRDSGAPGAIAFDPSTNLPIVDYDENRNSYETNTNVFNFAVGDVVNSIATNYLSGEFFNYYDRLGSAKSLQSTQRKSHTAGVFSFDDYSPSVEVLDYIDGSETPGIGLLAIVAFKTRINGDERVPESPLVLLERDKNQITDYAVVYGATYEYSLHTLGLSTLSDDTGELMDFLVLSPGGRKATITCVEAKPPDCVMSTNFRFLDSSMLVEWTLPSQTGDTGRPVNDIKYVQILERLTVDDPFQLHIMMDFNDSLLKIPLLENIPLARRSFTSMAVNYIEVPLPTSAEPKIWTVCTVDAHGNSSTLSAQFRATVDSLNNYTMEHVAYPGAPKQYPNLTVVNDAFVDSIRVSGCTRLEVYHNPTITKLVSSTDETLVEISTEDPTTGELMHSYSLQLIDLETQVDQIINFYIKEK